MEKIKFGIKVLFFSGLIFFVSGCELLVLLKDGKPEKEDFQLYDPNFTNISNVPKCNGIYIREELWDGEQFYRYYKFYESGQVLYGNFESLSDSITVNLKYSQKGYYKLLKDDFLKLEMFANGYRFYYFLEADINVSSDTIIIRKKTRHNGANFERMSKKYIFIEKDITNFYPTW